MTESQKTSASIKARFFIRLFVATFCAWAIPHISYRFMQLNLGAISITFSLNSFIPLVLGLAMVSGLGTGLVVSSMQWIALRPYIQSTWRWFVGLVLAWIFGDVVHMILLIVVIKVFPEWGHVQAVLFRLIGQGLAVGIPAGLIQQALLQKRTGIRIWWLVVAPLSILSAILIYTGNATLREGFLIVDPIYSSLLAGLMMAAISSWPTVLLLPVEEAGQTIPAVNPKPTNSTQLENDQS